MFKVTKENVSVKIAEVLLDPAASDWLKDALREAVNRDAVDAANEAAILALLLSARYQKVVSEQSSGSSIYHYKGMGLK